MSKNMERPQFEFIVFKEHIIEKLKFITIHKDYEKLWDLSDFCYFLMRYEKNITFFSEFSGLNSAYYSINSGKIGIYKNFSKIPDKQIDIENVSIFLRYGFLPHGRTFYKNVFRILPGRIYEYKDGIVLQKFIKIPENKAGLNEKKDFRNFKMLFEGIISSDYYSDDSTIMYSGGIDSSCMICALKNSGNKVNSLSVRFDEKEFDEEVYRREFININSDNHKDIFINPIEYTNEIKKYLNSSHKNLLTSTQDIWAFSTALKKAEIEYSDVYFGLGGDEFFCGYNYMTNVFSDFSDYSEIFRQNEYKSETEGLSNILLTEFINTISDHFAYLPKYFEEKEVNYLTKNTLPELYHKIDNYDVEDFYKSLILFQFFNELPGNQYPRLNSIANLTSNFIKTPLGNTEILTYSLSLGLKSGIFNNINKYTLYNMYKEIIPEEILNRKKQGFRIPLLNWIKQGHFDFMKPVILSKLNFLNIDMNYIQNLYKLQNPAIDKEKLWLLINLSIML